MTSLLGVQGPLTDETEFSLMKRLSPGRRGGACSLSL